MEIDTRHHSRTHCLLYMLAKSTVAFCYRPSIPAASPQASGHDSVTVALYRSFPSTAATKSSWPPIFASNDPVALRQCWHQSYKCAADSYNAYPGSMSENPHPYSPPADHFSLLKYRSNVRNPHPYICDADFRGGRSVTSTRHPAILHEPIIPVRHMRLNNALDLDI